MRNVKYVYSGVTFGSSFTMSLQVQFEPAQYMGRIDCSASALYKKRIHVCIIVFPHLHVVSPHTES